MTNKLRSTMCAIAAALAAPAALPEAASAADYVITAPSCGPYHLYLCKDPGERARNEKRLKDIEAAEVAQSRAELEARLRREAEVRDMMDRLNLSPQQEADARRLNEMRRAAEAAKPRLAGVSAPTPPTANPGNACPVRKPYDEVNEVSGGRLPSREAAMGSLMRSPGVYDIQCSSNDFGWQCRGKRKTGRILQACVGTSAQ